MLGVALGGDRDVAADTDQVAADGQVIDQPAIIGGVGRRRGAIHQIGQIAQAAQFLEGHVLAKPLHQHDGLGQLTLANVLLHGREQALVEGLVEVAPLQLVAQALIGRVVEQQRAQQRLFRLDIGGRMLGVGLGGAQVEGRDDGHGGRIDQGPARCMRQSVRSTAKAAPGDKSGTTKKAARLPEPPDL